MNYYVDIKLLTDTEISLGFLWKKLYAQIHLALVEVRDEKNLVSIGLAFPNYSDDRFLGDTLRLFAPTKEELERLDLNRWLIRLLDYLTVSDVKEVPSNVTEFVSFRRKQFKTNVERLARRQFKRQGIKLVKHNLKKLYSLERLLKLTLVDYQYQYIEFSKKFISYEEALKNYENFDEEERKKKNRLPYINVKSLSSDREMKIFIEKSKAKEESHGLFSTYGLSSESTVPCF
jgi:CRISPR-associated endonuclease Csy4